MNRLVAYQGVPGAFGEQACRRFLPNHRPTARPTFAAVADAVASGDTAIGMLPVENTCAGPVPGIAALIAGGRLVVRRRHKMPIRLHLMAKPGATLATIRLVASHEMALRQCASTLALLGLQAEPAANSAHAALELIDSNDPGRGVIASAQAAALYGLVILRRDVQDRPDNATIFCEIARAAAVRQ